MKVQIQRFGDSKQYLWRWSSECLALDEFQILHYYTIGTFVMRQPNLSNHFEGYFPLLSRICHCLARETLHLVPKGGLVLVKAALSKCYYVRWRPDTDPGCLTGSTFFPLIAQIKARARARLPVSRQVAERL